MSRRVHVSDHALVRYLDRVGGFQIERLCREIAARLQPFAGVGRGAVIIDGHAYVMDRHQTSGGVILVTVLPPGSDHRIILSGGQRR